MSLTRADVAAVLRGVTYRPGWSFLLDDDPYEGLVLWIRAKVENSYRPEEPWDLAIATFVPLPVLHTPQDFLDWLLWRCLRIESHECREWLRVHGKPISDPHAERVAPDLRAAVTAGARVALGAVRSGGRP